MTRIPEPESSDYDAVLQLIFGGVGSQVVRTLATLSVAEHLEAGPLSAYEIAEREQADPDSTNRLLRAAAALGLVKYHVPQRLYETTPKLGLLHTDSPRCLRSFAEGVVGSPVVHLPAVGLPEAVKEGRPQAAKTLGRPIFEYLGERPEEVEAYSAGMTDISTPIIRDALPFIAVDGAKSAVDVGGAEGVFVKNLIQAHPEIAGTVLDLPEVIASVRDALEMSGIRGVAGDFFASTPSADIYLLKFILHDWDDAACSRLLSNIRSAMTPNARVFVVELLMDESNLDPYASLLDMVMMYLHGGRERTEAEFDALFDEADLIRTKMTALSGGYVVIEAAAR